MSSSIKPNKNTALATNQKVIQGVDKHFAKVKSMTIAGVSYTPAALKALFQGEIDAFNALDASKAQMTEQVASTRATRAKASVTRKGLRAYILGNYGVEAVQVLEDFGMSPPKPAGPKTAEAMAASIAKATATRKAKKLALLALKGASIWSPGCNEPPVTLRGSRVAGPLIPESATISYSLGCKRALFIKDEEGLYEDDPKKNKNAKHIPRISAKELMDADFPDMVLERIVIEYLQRARFCTELQIVNGLERGNITRALAGEDVGTIIYKG